MQQLTPERLADEIHSTQAFRAFNDIDVQHARGDDDRRARPLCAHALDEPEPVAIGHFQIDEQDIGGVGQHGFKRRPGAINKPVLVAPLFEPSLEHRPLGHFIVDNENRRG